MNILDPRFRYVPAAQTDIRRTFARERARLEQEKAERELRALLPDGRLLAWFAAHAVDERADMERALDALDADDRR